MGGAVDHDRGEAAVDAGLAGLEVGAVVQMQGDGQLGVAQDGSLDQLHQVVVVRIGAGALGDLEDDRGLLLGAGFGDALDDFHIVDIERADGVAAVVGLLEHFGRGYERHNNSSFFVFSLWFSTKFTLYILIL